MQARGRGRPRIPVAIRTRIVQLRASNPARPMSLDAILKQLAKEEWRDLPSRGSVQKIVSDWEHLPEEIRQRDLPFRWHQLDRARLPWEASGWVARCHVLYERYHLDGIERLTKMYPEADAQEILDFDDTFTNRWACWCWRVHLAVERLPEMRVLIIAYEYTLAEQIQDLVPDHPQIDMSGWDDMLLWLSYDLRPEDLVFYADALKHGLVKPIPDLADILRLKEQLPDVTTSGHPYFAAIILGALRYTDRWNQGLADHKRDSTEIYEVLMREARNEGNTEATE